MTGVLVERDGETREVLADAVVLATGGFSRDRAMLERFAPQMAQALLAGGEGNHGDGLLMAMKLGAGLRDLPYVKGTYGIFHEPHPARTAPESSPCTRARSPSTGRSPVRRRVDPLQGAR